MARVCEITGKKTITGNKVSHSNRKTRRVFLPNLFKKKFYVPELDTWVMLRVSAKGIRTINKIGVLEAMKRAEKKGYLN